MLEATDSKGQKAVTDSTFLQSHKLRQVRAANIQAGNNLQVSLGCAVIRAFWHFGALLTISVEYHGDCFDFHFAW